LFTGMALSAILVTIGLMVGKPAPRLAAEASGRPPR
jgi:hypothetical protein